MEFKVKDEVLNAVLAYLATRPFQEVAGLIKLVHENVEVIAEVINEEKAVSGNDQEG